MGFSSSRSGRVSGAGEEGHEGSAAASVTPFVRSSVRPEPVPNCQCFFLHSFKIGFQDWFLFVIFRTSLFYFHFYAFIRSFSIEDRLDLRYVCLPGDGKSSQRTYER